MLTNIKQNRSALYTSIIFTLFFFFSIVQIGLFGAATTSLSQFACSPLAQLMFNLMTIGEGALAFYCLLGLTSTLMLKFYFIPIIFGTLVFLYKIALIIYVAVQSMYILGNCYINDTLKQGIYSSFAVESLLILVTFAMLGRTSVLNRMEVLSSFSVTRNYTIQ